MMMTTVLVILVMLLIWQINIILVMSFAIIFLGLEFIFLSSVLWGIRDGSKLKHETEVKKKCQWIKKTFHFLPQADDIVNKSVWCISFKTWSFVPCFLNLMVQLSSQVEPIRNLFAALFLSSIGMLIHVQFLWTHVDILLASIILVIAVKTTVSAVMRKAFRYYVKTSFLMIIKDALNSALVEEMAAGSSIFIMGEEVGEYQGA
ncbi:unnamed protein product [Lactuca saligna]|uniref:Uncharacterized protein n=1 Tax=Lactuca saligna TaxID=75948 RepID=A0AA35ZWK5_LACSI|nr:unnamed protein product [Lactuca saligna]